MRKRDSLPSSHLDLFYTTPLKHAEVWERGEPCIPEAGRCLTLHSRVPRASARNTLLSHQLSPTPRQLSAWQGALSGRPQGSEQVCTVPPRAPEQRTDLWVGARQAWHCLLEICSQAAVR